VGRVENLFLVFQAFHGSVISTARAPHFGISSTRSPRPACGPAIKC
jgi:hypothetical protein